jgi:uncharacterized membrane protein
MEPEHVLAIIALSIATIILLFLYLRYRTRVEYQVTVRSAIEKGQSLTPEFLAGLTERPPRRSSNRDLRFGVIAVALGIGIASFGLIGGGGDEVERVMMAVGNVPLLIGLALIVLWKFQPRD